MLSLLRSDTNTLEPARPLLSRTKSPSRISSAASTVRGVGGVAAPRLGDASTVQEILKS